MPIVHMIARTKRGILATAVNMYLKENLLMLILSGRENFSGEGGNRKPLLFITSVANVTYDASPSRITGLGTTDQLVGLLRLTEGFRQPLAQLPVEHQNQVVETQAMWLRGKELQKLG